MRFVIRKLFVFILFFSTLPSASWATHLRAGEILAQLVDCNSPFHYKLTLVLYTDLGSTVRPGGGVLDYGDGSPQFTFNARDPDFFEDLGDLVGHNIFYTEHTFPGPGTYIIRYRESNRNAGVANMDNSVNTPFYIETKIVIDPFLGCDNTPILLNPPLDQACIGRAFYHNPGAFDIDGDSLSYEVVVNKQDKDLPVANYSFPNIYDIATVPGASTEEQPGTPPIYTLDPVTGNLTWDAPAQEGEYNIAFLIQEWRYIPYEKKWIQIGYVTRDMQIIVMQCDNQRPELKIPLDTCIQAGTVLKADITATDPDNDPITISAFGGPFQVNPHADYTPQPEDPINPQTPPAIIHFSWPTGCRNVQRRPYQITFKAKDDPPKGKGAALTDFENWFITVIAPAPEGLVATAIPGRKIRLTWDNYTCRDDATSIQIWRRVDSFDIEPGPCDMGMPANAGYELIANVSPVTTKFTDNNNGEGLDYGADYCYRLVAQFPLPGGGESFVSEESCATIEESEKRFGPVITKVSVSSTNVSDGTIDLQWTSPFEADQATYPPPYIYDVYRNVGNVRSFSTAEHIAKDITDTVLVDTELNTEDLFYNYRVIAKLENGTVVDTSAWASSVRLNAQPRVNKIALNWEANVPWSNDTQEFPEHYIYRNKIKNSDPEAFELIDSVNVNVFGFNFQDSGQVGQKLDQKSLYCYYVTTQGSYGNPKIIHPLRNNSQIICSQPNDTVPPCKIETGSIHINKDIDCKTFLNDKPCNFDSYFHILSWSIPRGSSCEDDVRNFEIWFSQTGDDNDFKLLTTISDTTYTHEGLSSFAGCYKIRAVDRSGNMGEFSDKVCYENCPNYELPNVFTPNNDGHNDEFQAFSFPYNKCPRFVKSVDFRVFDRWGSEIYHTAKTGETSIFINWDGRTNDGKIADSGVYYYIANVDYDNVKGGLQHQELKGWIQVLR